MDIWLIWVLAGLLLLGAELLLPGIFLLWAGLASVGTGLAWLALAPGFPAAVVIFVALMAAGVALGLRRRGAGASSLNTPEAGLAGREGRVLAADETGLRVRIGDSDWSARPAAGARLPAGTAVRVEAVEGTVLVVRALD
ncbi:NfeD family protein [Roseomonas nepalensis]|uniref:NfeD family protein n=1 Tax=Muricoccus nepalensis TaxID=1854500 RepID=A0A502FWF7_9PROT|nr:NfeD family protein [Roseomonas nepalensis]TPG53814.1 NfeD family protein [Roseomonas nepalensis]